MWSSLATLLTIFVSSANFRILFTTPSSKSLMKIMNNKGPKIDPWGTPLITAVNLEHIPLITTLCSLPVNQFSIQFIIEPVSVVTVAGIWSSSVAVFLLTCHHGAGGGGRCQSRRNDRIAQTSCKRPDKTSGHQCCLSSRMLSCLYMSRRPTLVGLHEVLLSHIVSFTAEIYGEYLVNVHFGDIPHTFTPHVTLHSAEKIRVKFSASYPLTTFRILQNIPFPTQKATWQDTQLRT